MLALSPWVAQSCIYGDSLRSCCVVIVCPNMEAVKKWAAANGKDDVAPESLMQNEDLRKQVLDDLVQVCTANK